MPQTKSPASLPGFPCFVARRRLRRLFLNRVVVAALSRRRFDRLRTTAWALGERRLDLLDRFGLGQLLHRGDFASEPVQRGFIKLPLGIGLLGLCVGAIEIA